jgi:hypothetical protein
VSSWSCQPGQPANLAEVVWSPAEAALRVQTVVIERFRCRVEQKRTEVTERNLPLTANIPAQ